MNRRELLKAICAVPLTGALPASRPERLLRGSCHSGKTLMGGGGRKTSQDVWDIITSIESAFDERTGLTELVYGRTTRTMRSAS
jgi:hypothetical protein